MARRRRSKVKDADILIGVAALAALGAGAYLLTKKAKKEEERTTEETVIGLPDGKQIVLPPGTPVKVVETVKDFASIVSKTYEVSEKAAELMENIRKLQAAKAEAEASTPQAVNPIQTVIETGQKILEQITQGLPKLELPKIELPKIELPVVTEIVKYPYPSILYVSLVYDNRNVPEPVKIPVSISVTANGYSATRSVTLYPPGTIEYRPTVLNFTLPENFRDRDSIAVSISVKGSATGVEEQWEKAGETVETETERTTEMQVSVRKVKYEIINYYKCKYEISYSGAKTCSISGGQGVYKGWGEGGKDIENVYIFNYGNITLPVSIAKIPTRTVKNPVGFVEAQDYTAFKPWFKLVNGDGRPIVNESVTVTIQGFKTYNLSTNGNGIVTLPEQLPWSVYYSSAYGAPTHLVTVTCRGVTKNTNTDMSYLHTTTIKIGEPTPTPTPQKTIFVQSGFWNREFKWVAINDVKEYSDYKPGYPAEPRSVIARVPAGRVTFSAEPAEGFRFKGWYDGETGSLVSTSNPYIVELNDNTMLNAKAEVKA